MKSVLFPPEALKILLQSGNSQEKISHFMYSVYKKLDIELGTFMVVGNLKEQRSWMLSPKVRGFHAKDLGLKH